MDASRGMKALRRKKDAPIGPAIPTHRTTKSEAGDEEGGGVQLKSGRGVASQTYAMVFEVCLGIHPPFGDGRACGEGRSVHEEIESRDHRGRECQGCGRWWVHPSGHHKGSHVGEQEFGRGDGVRRTGDDDIFEPVMGIVNGPQDPHFVHGAMRERVERGVRTHESGGFQESANETQRSAPRTPSNRNVCIHEGSKKEKIEECHTQRVRVQGGFGKDGLILIQHDSRQRGGGTQSHT